MESCEVKDSRCPDVLVAYAFSKDGSVARCNSCVLAMQSVIGCRWQLEEKIVYNSKEITPRL